MIKRNDLSNVAAQFTTNLAYTALGMTFVQRSCRAFFCALRESNRNQESGIRNQESGIRNQETGNGKQETGIARSAQAVGMGPNDIRLAIEYDEQIIYDLQ
jgi:hypothetical protein